MALVSLAYWLQWQRQRDVLFSRFLRSTFHCTAKDPYCEPAEDERKLVHSKDNEGSICVNLTIWTALRSARAM